MERNRFRVVPSARLPNDEEQLVDNVEEMADAEAQAINSGATNDGVGGATNAADVDSTSSLSKFARSIARSHHHRGLLCGSKSDTTFDLHVLDLVQP